MIANLQKNIWIVSKYAMLVMIIQCAFGSVILAHESAAQGTDEVYLSVNWRDVELVDALANLKRKTGYDFFYKDAEITDLRNVTLTADNTSLKEILIQLSRKKNLKFVRLNNVISVIKVREKRKHPVIVELDLEKEISGKVTDENGEGLPGVNVLSKGTDIGAITDVKGNYRLNVPDDATTLIFSYVGYLTEEVEIAGRSVIDISLNPDIETLSEIIVVGYGSQKKADLTGSVSNISTADLESRPITNLSAGLSGLTPGVQVTQGSGGRIGSDNAVIRIRGVGTLNNSNPLVLVDGVSSSMNDIDPNDVASITVLKDAASAAIYGSRAANGVILITTKRGEEGRLSVSYSGYAGWQQATKKQEYVSNFATWMELANENRTNGGLAPIFSQADVDEWRNSNNALTHPNVDWYDIQTGDKAFLQSHSLSVSGGNSNTSYRLSLGFLDQNGLQKPNGQERYNVRANVESEIAKGFKLGTNLFYRWTDLDPTVNTSNGSGVDFNVVPAIPDIQSPDGLWGGSQHSSIGIVFNPLWNLSIQNQSNRQQRFLGSIYSDWEIIPGLTFKANISLNSNTRFNTSFIETSQSWNFRENAIAREVDINSASSEHIQDYLVTNFYTLDYEKTIGDHRFNALAGYQFETFRQDRVRATVSEFPGNALQVIDAGLSNPGVGGNISEWAIRSFFGRLNYAFKDKYLLEANIRSDGSSRFREGKKWGSFPSVSIGWRVSEEGFLSDVSFLSDLKLRGSWGKLGNQLIGTASDPNNYPYQATYNLNQNYSFGGTVVSGIAQNDLANQDITWEETTTTNIGLDAGLFDNRLEVTFEYFKRVTDGILFEQPIPDFLGNKGAPTVNLAEVVNKGWEASVNYRNDINRRVTFTAGIHITQVDNEVTKFFGETFSGGTFIIQEGQPFRAIRGLEAVGIFQSQDEIDNAPTHPGAVAPGDIRYRDQLTVDTNGDGVPDEADGVINSDDRTVVGNTLPRFLFGANFNVQYGNFDLGIILQGVSDVDTYAGGGFAYQAFAQSDRGLVSSQWLDRWTPENPTNEWPRLIDGSAYSGNRQTSSFWVNDISFLRLKNIQLGYNIPPALLGKFGVEKARVYVSSDNLLTFTDWAWDFDPERTQTATTPGLPNLTTFILGLNVRF